MVHKRLKYSFYTIAEGIMIMVKSVQRPEGDISEGDITLLIFKI